MPCYHVRYSTKIAHNDPSRRITHVGGFDGEKWKFPVDEVIQRIARGEKFYVHRPQGGCVNVTVTERVAGKPYLTTAIDDEPNSLLYLPECPA